MTFFVAQLDLAIGLLTYSNAGHNFPILIYNNGKAKRLLVTGNRLGNQKQPDYKEKSIQLEKGDLLFFFTDGLTENVNSQGEERGERSLMRYLKKHQHLSPQALIDSLVGQMNQFNEGVPLEDDVTMVAIRMK